MRALLLTAITLIRGSFLSGAEPMYVSICNIIGVPQTSVTRARAETELAFEAAGVGISWIACDTVATAKAELGDRLFIVRLLGDAPVHTLRNASLEAMGRAYTQERGSGVLADAYVNSVNTFAESWRLDRGALLGLVISHELGHVLLGPGHVSQGIMSGTWKSREVAAVRKRWLRFPAAEAALIQQELERRPGAPQSR